MNYSNLNILKYLIYMINKIKILLMSWLMIIRTDTILTYKMTKPNQNYYIYKIYNNNKLINIIII